MPLVKSAMCDLLNKEADLFMTLIETEAQIIFSGIETILNFVSKLDAWSPRQLVQKVLGDLVNNYNTFCPAINEADDVVNMINKCTILADVVLASPLALYTKTVDYLIKQANKIIAALAAGLPEIQIGQLIRNLVNQLKIDLSIDKHIDKVKKILGCLQAICGVDIESFLIRLNNVLNRCYMNGSGNIDTDKLLAAFYIKPYIQDGSTVIQVDRIEIINNIGYAIDGVGQAYNVLDTSISAIKSALAQTKLWYDPFDPWPVILPGME